MKSIFQTTAIFQKTAKGSLIDRIASVVSLSTAMGLLIAYSLPARPAAWSDPSHREAIVHRVSAKATRPAPLDFKDVPGLEKPLVATGQVSRQKNEDLDIALAALRAAPANTPDGDYDDYAKPLQAFIATHPKSSWNAALYTNLGFGYYRAGYYSRTFAYLEMAWTLGRNAKSPQARLMIDRAVGELAKMHARLGHADELEALFRDIGKRPIGGPATELIQGAHEGLWAFRYHPETAYLCGPSALRNLLFSVNAAPKQIKVTDDARSGQKGFSLQQLAKLADSTGLQYNLVYRAPGQPVPVPSVVNWTTHHYAAIISEQDGRYQVKDPTFGSAAGMPLTKKAIDAESSGYFLIPHQLFGDRCGRSWIANAPVIELKGSSRSKHMPRKPQSRCALEALVVPAAETRLLR